MGGDGAQGDGEGACGENEGEGGDVEQTDGEDDANASGGESGGNEEDGEDLRQYLANRERRLTEQGQDEVDGPVGEEAVGGEQGDEELEDELEDELEGELEEMAEELGQAELSEDDERGGGCIEDMVACTLLDIFYIFIRYF